MAFNHENLKVYQRTLPFNSKKSIGCAACLDLACIKRLLDADLVYAGKEELSQSLRMLVDLRMSWSNATPVVREERAEYSPQGEGVDKARDKARDKEESSQ